MRPMLTPKVEAKLEGAANQGTLCALCGKPLVDTWRIDGHLCCECGLDQELFHPETRRSDASISSEAPKNTDGRVRSLGLSLLRLWLKLLSAIAPAAAEALAARIFFTPQRRPRRAPPTLSNAAATSFRLSSGKHEIACWSWGRGPTVILVHGWEGHGAQLIRFAQPLIQSGFRVVTFDMPAHGSSTGRELSAFDMSRAIQSIAEIFEPIHAVIAHSLGGAASIFALSEGLEVQRVVLLAPAAEPSYYARVLASRLGLPQARAEGMRRRIENRIGMRLEDASVLRFVPPTKAPLLVMHDPFDPDVPFEHGKSIAQAWPGARLEVLGQMGHRGMLRDSATIGLVTGFIAGQTNELTSRIDKGYQDFRSATSTEPARQSFQS